MATLEMLFSCFNQYSRLLKMTLKALIVAKHSWELLASSLLEGNETNGLIFLMVVYGNVGHLIT